MTATRRLVRNLGRLRQDGQQLQSTLDDLDDAIEAGRDRLDAPKSLANKVRGLARTASSLKTISRFLSAAPIVGVVVRQLTPAFGRLEQSADTLADYADRLDRRLQPVRDKLRTAEGKVETAETKVIAATATIFSYESSAASLNDAFPGGNPPDPVKKVAARANKVLEPTLDTVDAAANTLSDLYTQVQAPLDLIDRAIAPFDQALAIALDIERTLGSLNQPLQDLNSGLKPFEALFGAVDAVVNTVLAPIINPILEVTGLQSLIDQLTDSLDPLERLTDPIESAINNVTAQLDDLTQDIDVLDGVLPDVSTGLESVKLGKSFPLDAVVTGNKRGNVFSGSDLANVFQGLGNSDVLVGGGGDDSLDGGDADDRLYGGLGIDTLIGGKGADRLVGGEGDDQLFGNGGKDWLGGGDGNDLLEGGGGSDRLIGGNGFDVLLGGGGRDVLLGGRDADVLEGGGGNDLLNGGKDDDRLSGGKGSDVFVLARGAGFDIITDFSRRQDQIRLGKGLTRRTITVTRQDGNTLISLGDEAIAQLDGVAKPLRSRHFI